MPTRKQRKRVQKERRHEYETVWVDSEGNPLDEPPEDAVPATRDKKPQQNGPKQRQSRPLKAPLAPSWQRSIRRSLMLGAVIFVAFAFVFRSKTGQHQYSSAVLFAVVYTALFVPFTYYFDRFIYRRWERKTAEQPKKR